MVVLHETHEPTSYEDESRFSGEEEEEEEAEETESYTVNDSEEQINYWHFRSIFQYFDATEMVQKLRLVSHAANKAVNGCLQDRHE